MQGGWRYSGGGFFKLSFVDGRFGRVRRNLEARLVWFTLRRTAGHRGKNLRGTAGHGGKTLRKTAGHGGKTLRRTAGHRGFQKKRAIEPRTSKTRRMREISNSWSS